MGFVFESKLKMSRKVLIAGGSGMIGRLISQLLVEAGDEVAWLTRKRNPDEHIRQFIWNPAKKTIDQEAVDWSTHIINLAGVSIGETRWTKNGKAQILNSRIDSVETLNKAIGKKANHIESFVGVSGLGYYGPSNTPQREENKAGNDFPAKVAEAWEKAYSKIENVNQKAILRLTVVLSTKGGALPQIMLPIKFGFGTVLGKGTQPFAWIHLEDAARAFIEALNWNGIYNLSAPEILNNKNLTYQIASILSRPILLPAAPEFVLKIVLGARSGLLLNGTIPDLSKLNRTGFTCKFKEFMPALKDLILRKI